MMFKEFNKKYEAEISELEKAYSRLNFEASVSGNPIDYKAAADASLRYENYLSKKDLFEAIKSIRINEKLNQLESRTATLIYNSFLSNQIDSALLKRVNDLTNLAEEKYATYRVFFNDKLITDNEVDRILEESTNTDELKSVWESSKEIGVHVSDIVAELIELKNEAARKVGFENHHTMSLKLSELEPAFLDKLFNQLDNDLRSVFNIIKSETDDFLSKRFGLMTDELMPWHYQDRFFQHSPKLFETDFDVFYKDANLEKITKDYFFGIGLDISDLLMKSDLYEKPNKYQHAFCSDIDRNGDIRVLCNLKQNSKWMGTMLHEFGHAVYDKFIDKNLPWQLRTHSHIFTTEAIAMLFGRLSNNVYWINKNVAKIDNLEALNFISKKILMFEQIIFSRWVQVVYRFERELYSNPKQNLNTLWWDLVEEYQNLRKPDGRENKYDYLSKIHIAIYPAYYHNYMLGELLASQLQNFISTNVISENHSKDFSGKEIGEYLINRFFKFGASLSWNELIKNATNEELNISYFINEFANNEK